MNLNYKELFNNTDNNSISNEKVDKMDKETFNNKEFEIFLNEAIMKQDFKVNRVEVNKSKSNLENSNYIFDK